MRADSVVVHLQADMWAAKREGSVEIVGIGHLSWMELVSLADVILGMIWTALTLKEQEDIFRRYIVCAGKAGERIYDSRYGSFKLLAWLLHGWPDSEGAKVAQRMLRRWLSSDRNLVCRHLRRRDEDQWTSGPNNFAPATKARLEALVGMSWESEVGRK